MAAGYFKFLNKTLSYDKKKKLLIHLKKGDRFNFLGKKEVYEITFPEPTRIVYKSLKTGSRYAATGESMRKPIKEY